MYRLADKVGLHRVFKGPSTSKPIMIQLGLDELKEYALEDIRSKLSTDNVLDELFSQFTSRYAFMRV